MSDLISRQAVLDIVERNENKDDALYEIEHLLSAEKNWWISVNDRLPEALMAKVLVFAVDEIGLPLSVQIGIYDGFNKEWEVDLDGDIKVVAWMPLPELPEVESKEV